jgi:hypothetical protein
MNSRLQRFLAIAGTAVVTVPALATFGTPATAAGARSPDAAAVKGSAESTQAHRRHGRWVRLMEFETRRECMWWGRRGERRDWWEDYRCVRDRRWDRRWSDEWDDDWDRDRDPGWHHGDWYDRDYRLWVRFDDD